MIPSKITIIDLGKGNPPVVNIGKSAVWNSTWDTTTPFAENFKIEEKKVTRIIQDTKFYQITSKQTIPQNAITELTFQLHQYGSQYSTIVFGIITESRKNEMWSYGEDQAVGYWTSQ